MGEPTRVVLAALADSGLMLQQDKRLPNVVTLVSGESLRASWWSHGQAARELELRMLVRTAEVHTESGRHEMEAEG